MKYQILKVLNGGSGRLTAVVGRDEPKDIFDLFLLSTITEFNWNTIAEIAHKKELFEYDILEYRLKTFPLFLLDKLAVKDQVFLSAVKADYQLMIDDIVIGGSNRLFRSF